MYACIYACMYACMYIRIYNVYICMCVVYVCVCGGGGGTSWTHEHTRDTGKKRERATQTHYEFVSGLMGLVSGLVGQTGIRKVPENKFEGRKSPVLCPWSV